MNPAPARLAGNRLEIAMAAKKKGKRGGGKKC